MGFFACVSVFCQIVKLRTPPPPTLTPSPLPPSLIWNLYTNMIDGCFPHLTPQLWGPKRQLSVLILTLATARETASEGKTYSCSSSHSSDRVQSSAKTGHTEGKYPPPPPAWAAICWSGCSSFRRRMDVFIRWRSFTISAPLGLDLMRPQKKPKQFWIKHCLNRDGNNN